MMCFTGAGYAKCVQLLSDVVGCAACSDHKRRFQCRVLVVSLTVSIAVKQWQRSNTVDRETHAALQLILTAAKQTKSKTYRASAPLQ